VDGEENIEAQRIRALIAGVGPRGRTTPLPKAVSEQIARYASEQHSAGRTWGELAVLLGITREAVRAYSGEAEGQFRIEAEDRFRTISMVNSGHRDRSEATLVLFSSSSSS
jgi:predicted transcriptional regulator